jgi:hypothetical protein
MTKLKVSHLAYSYAPICTMRGRGPLGDDCLQLTLIKFKHDLSAIFSPCRGG